MNRARVAALLRELADEIDEEAVASPKQSRTVKKAKPRSHPLPAEPTTPTDLDMMRAKNMLRRRGIT